MKKGKYGNKEIITITELSYYLGTRRRLLERLISLEVIEPQAVEPEYSFSIDLVPRMKKILRLHNQLGVSWTSMGLVLDLLNKIDHLESIVRKSGKG